MQSKLVLAVCMGMSHVKAQNEMVNEQQTSLPELIGGNGDQLFESITDFKEPENIREVQIDTKRSTINGTATGGYIREVEPITSKQFGLPPVNRIEQPFPMLAEVDWMNTVANTTAGNIRYAIYEDKDNWNTTMYDLNESYDFSFAQLFSKKVFTGEFKSANSKADHFMGCVGDDGTYGAICQVSGVSYPGQYRVPGSAWSTMQKLLTNYQDAQTPISQAIE